MKNDNVEELAVGIVGDHYNAWCKARKTTGSKVEHTHRGATHSYVGKVQKIKTFLSRHLFHVDACAWLGFTQFLRDSQELIKNLISALYGAIYISLTHCTPLFLIKYASINSSAFWLCPLARDLCPRYTRLTLTFTQNVPLG